MSRQDDRSRRDRVARYVASRRADLGLSQETLAAHAGINPKTVLDLERGRRAASARTRQKLEPALGWVEGDINRIADGGYPVTGPLPDDDSDGLYATATGESAEPEFGALVRQVISRLPADSQPVLEELYEMYEDAERQNRRLRQRIVQLMPRGGADDSPDAEGREGRESGSQPGLPNS